MNKRFWSPVNLEQFSNVNPPIEIGKILVKPPKVEQMVLRMLVRSPYSENIKLPSELKWLQSLIEKAEQFQFTIGVRHPFLYITVRNGNVNSTLDDAWHTDGFSTKYHHLPEANYVWVNSDQPTEWVEQKFEFPLDFDALKHNVHLFCAKRVLQENIRRCKDKYLYFFDPYVVHRRPPITFGKWRTFVRISFTPIEIPDINNTLNPLIKTDHYIVDGVKNFRNSLLDYDLT